MQDPNVLLTILGKMARKSDVKFEKLFQKLYNKDLWLLAYESIAPNQGNMTAAGPAFVNAGTTDTITVNWTGLLPDTIYLGGISHNTPQGLSALTIIRIGN